MLKSGDGHPLQQLQQAVQDTFHVLQQNQRQLYGHLDRSLRRLALASISSGVQANPLHKEALGTAAAFGAKIGAFFNHHPKQPEVTTGDGRVVCLEFTKGKRRVYRRKASSDNEGFEVTNDHVAHRHRVRDVFQQYLLPQGYPDSVAPQYGTYMMWRGIQYFFGGAMSVFTTRSLLASLAMSRHPGGAAAAINWVLKDGAGRLGRFLFARWGRQLDCELKQFRLAGDALMEMGASLELATVLMPQAFLALACTANLAKNLAGVAASATRAPIYRSFAKQNNMADITAKGESVANLADVFGTAFGIALAKMNLPVVPTFVLLSCGYLVASRREIDSVVLPYLNRARLSYASGAFLDSGVVPEPKEGNAHEPLTNWSDPVGRRIVLGASVGEACGSPAALEHALRTFSGRQYAITYRPNTRKAYILLKEGISYQQMLRATFDAQVLLFMINRQRQHGQMASGKGPAGSKSTSNIRSGRAALLLSQLNKASSTLDVQGPQWAEAATEYVAKCGPELYKQFEKQAVECGWRMDLTMLNANETRFQVA